MIANALSAGHLGCHGADVKDFVSSGICLRDIEGAVELRHLRYFVAVAESGSMKLAAQKRLHTAQPSLSRQIRDLEHGVGVPLLKRSVRGIELTAAGQAFLDHARLSLMQADAATEAARRAAQPTKTIFSVGFLTGQEAAWLAPVTRMLGDELPNIEIRVSSGFSTTLADDLLRRKIDIAFLRREPEPELEYRLVLREPLVAIMPSDHPLAARKSFDPRDLVGAVFIGISEIPRVLRGAVNGYLQKSGVDIVPRFGIDNFAMAMSLVTSERGVALLPISIEDYLPPSIVSRRLKGEQPTVDLMIGYHKANASPILRTFLSRFDLLGGGGSRRPAG
jgi:LysR family hca operon transcriptional activator